MCTGNRADSLSQSISKCAREIQRVRRQYWVTSKAEAEGGGDNQGRNTSYTESTVKVWYRSWYSSGLLCSFVINKLNKTLREPHSLFRSHYTTVSTQTLHGRFLSITLRVVSQFLYTTGKSEQKSVSRFLFLDF